MILTSDLPPKDKRVGCQALMRGDDYGILLWQLWFFLEIHNMYKVHEMYGYQPPALQQRFVSQSDSCCSFMSCEPLAGDFQNLWIQMSKSCSLIKVLFLCLRTVVGFILIALATSNNTSPTGEKTVQ